MTSAHSLLICAHPRSQNSPSTDTQALLETAFVGITLHHTTILYAEVGGKLSCGQKILARPQDGTENNQVRTTRIARHPTACLASPYEELRPLAATVRRDHPDTTLNPTALVNEAWLKLSKSPEIAATSLLHLKRIAAQPCGRFGGGCASPEFE